MKRGSLLIVLMAVIMAVAGCATAPNGTARSASGTEICPPCRFNNDLACLCVKVKESTPRMEYEGKTYYFCSEDCRIAFLKNPRKYLPRH